MIDAYAVADTILADYFGDGSGGGAEAVPVQDETYSDDIIVSDDVDLESVPKALEQGMKEKRVVEYDQWKKLDAEEMRRGAERGKERERMEWEDVHEFLTSARAW
jgi:adrenodoxin-NADP+ reductase